MEGNYKITTNSQNTWSSSTSRVVTTKMGMPDSKDVNTAFEQVTPLVEDGLWILNTTKYISLLGAAIQALNVALLWLILLSLLGLLITANPDLRDERQAVVTPVMQWVVSWVRYREDRKLLQILGFFMLMGLVFGIWMWIMVATDTFGQVADGKEEPVDEEEEEEEEELLDEAEAIEALKLTRRISEP